MCAFGKRLLPFVSGAFHLEPDEIPPASMAAIRQHIMQSSPRAKTVTFTDAGGFLLCVCVCMWKSLLILSHALL